MREQNHHPHTHDCDTHGCHGSLRNEFFRGKLMGAEEFRIEQRYFIERRRLLNRAVAGWGVAWGFGMKHSDGGPLCIGAGLALDCHGSELLLPDAVELRPPDAFVIDKDSQGCLRFAPDQTLRATQWLLSVHYAERGVEPMSMPGACGCAEEQYRYQCETVAFSLQAIDGCGCGEPECRKCGCTRADACGSGGRGPHRCLCHWVSYPLGCGPAHEPCEWRGMRLDVRAGVPLACVKIEVDPNDRCNPARFLCIDDDCGPRRILKNNELLYDLLRGCDLTHIKFISWHPWHRRPTEVPWSEFILKIPKPATRTECPTDFRVCFSKPVRTDTLTLDAFAITALISERGTGWGEPRRVPIRRIDWTPDGAYDPSGAPWPPGLTNQATIVVEWKWYDDEIDTEESWFDDRAVTLEIEVRGDLILDCNGIAVDANAHGLDPMPSGNGTPGGTFLSAFRVAQRSK